jgi:predicted Na+-dependent transporter
MILCFVYSPIGTGNKWHRSYAKKTEWLPKQDTWCIYVVVLQNVVKWALKCIQSSYELLFFFIYLYILYIMVHFQFAAFVADKND